VKGRYNLFVEMRIGIPTDNDGYVLLQCPLCGEYFKITPINYEDDGVLEIRCPNCGLISDDYFTEDVIELAAKKAKNYAMDLFHKEMKKWERQFKDDRITFKAGKKPKVEYESQIQTTIEAMTSHQYRCCGRSAKIKLLLQIIGSYCPFCGVKEFEAKQN
jgi:uncharacterized C2H2 Zn-finger protein